MVSTSEQQSATLEQNIIEVHNIEFHYGRNKAVGKLSFSLGRGEILGLIGKNGAGKTQLRFDTLIIEHRAFLLN